MSRAKKPVKKSAPRPPKDAPLMLAIHIAGGIQKLADKLGMTHPALREWARVPDHRVLQVEHVTGIPREQLRPDLYNQEAEIDRELHSAHAAMRILLNHMARLTLLAEQHPQHPKISEIVPALNQLQSTIQRFRDDIERR